ncbi:MAG: hypothetical protein EBU88_16620, partial [Acidobacteria bacterium]|nr:hypothetical protein [Acidobacteriota bacterium]
DEENRPVAERLVMRNGRSPTLRIHASQSKYRTRDSVSISMQWNSVDSTAIGSFSVSCADITRLSAERTGNILDAWFLADRFDRPLFNQMQLFHNGQPDPEKLNALLLTRGWRRYRWEDITRPSDRPDPSALLPGRGKVIAGKRLKGPFELAIFNPSMLQIVRTDRDGHFEIPVQDMVNRTRSQLLLTPYKKKYEYLQVSLDTLPAHVLSNRGSWPRPALSSMVNTEFAFSDRYLVLPFGFKELEEVVVVGKRNEKFISKNCQDYVCHNYVINCENHPGERGVPVTGQMYTYRFRPGETPQQVEYVGCDGVIAQAPRDFFAIPGINVPKEYYVYDLRKSSPDVPEYNTTIYWDPILELRSGQMSRATFFCSDWKGRFRITMEGVTPNGPVHIEEEITVE